MVSSSDFMEVVDAPQQAHDPAAAGGPVIPCCWAKEVEKMQSTHDREEVPLSICHRYGVREEDYRAFCAKDGWGPCETMLEGSNVICVYEDMLEAGVRFPLHDFYAGYLGHYSIAPSQLTPNAWRCLVGFVLLCDGAGVQPTVPVFRHYFKMSVHRGKQKGWYHVAPISQRRRLFKSDGLPSNVGWKKRFFFLEALSPDLRWRCPEKWGTPEQAALFVDPVPTDATRMAITRLEAEKAKRDISLMDILCKSRYHDRQAPVIGEAGAGAAATASTPKLKRNYISISAITPPEQLGTAMDSSPSDLVTPERPSRSDGGEHYSASQKLKDAMEGAYKAMRTIEEELYNARHELREERAKHAADVAQINKELGAAKAEHAADVSQINKELGAAKSEHTADVAKLTKELKAERARCADDVAKLKNDIADAVELAKKLQSLNAEQATKVARLTEEHQAAVTKVRGLAEELQAERTKRMTKVQQFSEDFCKAEAEHAAKVLQLRTELQEERAGRQLMVMDAKHKSYTDGWKEMQDLVLTLYPGVDRARLTPKALSVGAAPSGGSPGFKALPVGAAPSDIPP